MTPSDETQRTLILKPEVTRADVLAAANALDFDWTEDYEAVPEQGIFFNRVWVDREETTAIILIEDTSLDLNVLVTKGRRAKKTARQLAKRLDVWSEQELWRAVERASSAEALSASLRRWTMGRLYDMSRRERSALEEYLEHKSPAVRLAAVDSMGYLGHPGFIGLLDDVANADDDEQVRQAAQFVADGIRELS
ncbi:HEAT repeat domain-containing protein [Persicimonas caeni]|uniref:HEAT repeat domain-containing protein n=1 Tax=Persicimonas caeni TaxID=2292766 RepID=A0A4Y6PVK5_PERCE|nr:HEAT repeat domain-containing protein [Persicimonas caeni]QDG52273.1 HEAT repeat domain-containing protein [Persicimonas caeni]QED33495.1 HEAT repeat domain-containing protein [Persicimonas caeni]